MVKELSRRLVDPVVNVNEVSRFSEGVVINGDVSSVTDLRVDGHMEGKLYSEGRIVVGETAVIKGSVLCSDLDLWGTVDGDVYARNVLSVKGSAVVTGNIHVRKLQVEMGAQINGSCSMISEEEFDKNASDIVKVKVEKAQKPEKESRWLFNQPEGNPSPVQVDA